MGMTESQAEAWGDDTDSRRARCAGDEARSSNLLSCMMVLNLWMTSSSGEVGRRGCPGHLQPQIPQ